MLVSRPVSKSEYALVRTSTCSKDMCKTPDPLKLLGTEVVVEKWGRITKKKCKIRHPFSLLQNTPWPDPNVKVCKRCNGTALPSFNHNVCRTINVAHTHNTTECRNYTSAGKYVPDEVRRLLSEKRHQRENDRLRAIYDPNRKIFSSDFDFVNSDKAELRAEVWYYYHGDDNIEHPENFVDSFM